MFEIELQYPIYTLDGKELAPEGLKLNGDAIKKIILSSGITAPKNMRLMEFGSVKKRYFSIFCQSSL